MSQTSPAIRKHYLDSAQGQLHCRSCGEDPPRLVMLQILPFGTVLFEPLLPLLAQAGLSCLAIDLMGYGRSDKRRSSWMVQDYAANIDDALTRAGIVPGFLLGGHFAGMVAASLALRRRGEVHRLVLDGTPVWPEEYRRNIAAEMGVKPFTVTEDGQFMTDTWAQVMAMMRLLNPGFVVDEAASVSLRSIAVALLETTFGPSVVPAMSEFDMAPVLPQLDMPTLVLGATCDSQVRYFELLIDEIRQSQGHCFDGVHPMHDIGRPERAAEYAGVLQRFLLA